jgi:hypothetical protein
MSSCLASLIQAQNVSAKDVAGTVLLTNVTMRQVSSTVLKCIQSDKSTVKLVNKLVAEVDREAKVTEAASATAMVAMLATAAVVFAVILLLILLM